MKSDTNWVDVIMTMFIGILLFVMVLITLDLTPVQVTDRWETDAVSRGYGEYVVDKNRHVKFLWKTNNNVVTVTNVVYIP